VCTVKGFIAGRDDAVHGPSECDVNERGVVEAGCKNALHGDGSGSGKTECEACGG
jgi:hypothetical protein